MDVRNKIPAPIGNYRAQNDTAPANHTATQNAAPSRFVSTIPKGPKWTTRPRKTSSGDSTPPAAPLDSKKTKPSLQRRKAEIIVRALPGSPNLAEDEKSTSEASGSDELGRSELDQPVAMDNSTEPQMARNTGGAGKKLAQLVPKYLKNENKPKSHNLRMFDEILKQNTNPVFDPDDMELQARAHRALAPIVCKDMDAANVKAHEAFGMSVYEAFRDLRMSDVYSDACEQAKEDLGYMLRSSLEGFLWQLLDDPDARTKIKACNLTPTEAVALRFYGLQGFTNVQPTSDGSPVLLRWTSSRTW